MASEILTNVKIWAGEYDWSGDMNSVALEYAAEMQDATAFGQTTRINKAGLKTVRLANEGIWSAGTDEIDPEIFARIGTADVPHTVSVGSGALGDTCYFFRANRANYNPGAPVGELLRFSTEAMGSGGVGLVRGKILYNSTIATATTTTSTAVQVGAVASGQTLYAALHVFSATAGDTLDVKIQSDNASNFPSATDRITFTQVGASATYQWSSVAGAITDDYWRISAVTAGTSLSYSFAVVVGIL